MLLMEDVRKVYRAEQVETIALQSINIEIDQGEFVAVMGPSGCGKSTLLNIMGLLDGPSGGRYWFKGTDVSDCNEQDLAKVRKHHIGFIFQNFNLIDELTVAENIAMALRYHRISRRQTRRRVAEAMEQLALSHRADHRPPHLSGGQQQMVAVARAIVARQSLILADEPTGNLDSGHGQMVMQTLRDLNDQGTTIVMVTHSAAHADHARRTIHLFDGAVVAERVRGRPHFS